MCGRFVFGSNCAIQLEIFNRPPHPIWRCVQVSHGGFYISFKHPLAIADLNMAASYMIDAPPVMVLSSAFAKLTGWPWSAHFSYRSSERVVSANNLDDGSSHLHTK
jgi:hypothetical protein